MTKLKINLLKIDSVVIGKASIFSNVLEIYFQCSIGYYATCANLLPNFTVPRLAWTHIKRGLLIIV